MSNTRLYVGICAVLFLIGTASSDDDCNYDKVLFCYYSSWSIYRPSLGHYNVSEIDPRLCTHMVYAFAGINLDGYTFALDPSNDLPEAGGAGQYYHFREMRQVNPCLKIMLSIGGWNEGSEKFSVMVETEEARMKFIEHLIRYLIYYGFDGVDIDWEYPAQRGGIAADKANFVLFLTELKKRLESRNKEVAIAVAAPQGLAEISYDIRSISNIVDYVLLMTYDYDSKNMTSHVAPLYDGPGASNGYIDQSVKYWLAQGCPPKKLVLGVLSSGRSFTLEDPTKNGLGANVTGPGTLGEFTLSPGFLAYYEICDLQLYDPDKWKIHRNNNTGTYMTKDDQWVTYEDSISVEIKSKYALDNGLRGVLLWSIDTDDFYPLCSDEKYPLHRAIRKGLGLKKI